MKAQGITRLIGVAAVLSALLAPVSASAQDEAEVGAVAESAAARRDPITMVGGFAAAAFCVSVSVMGAAWAVSKVGAAAMGAVAEKPELMGRSLVYIGLAEGLAIYGLIIAILILGRLPS